MNFEYDNPFPQPDFYEIKAQVGEAIPPSCIDCPLQCALAKSLGGLILDKHEMSFFAEKLVGEDGQIFDDVVKDYAPAETANEIKSFVRGEAAAGLDAIDEQIASAEALMKSIATECDGVLKMRATKTGTTYTATICTSQGEYPDSDINHTEAHVKTRPANQA